MKGCFLFLLGIVLGAGGGYVAFEYDGGLLRKDGGVQLEFLDHFSNVLAPGDQVLLREDKFGYAIDVQQAPPAEGLEQKDEAATYEVTKVRRNYIVLRLEKREIVIPVSKISLINH